MLIAAGDAAFAGHDCMEGGRAALLAGGQSRRKRA